jgi:hypothetical protein
MEIDHRRARGLRGLSLLLGLLVLGGAAIAMRLLSAGIDRGAITRSALV